MSLPGKKTKDIDLLKRLFPQKRKKIKGKEPNKKKDPTIVNEFDTQTDWILTMILVAVMRINPDMKPETVIKKSMEWARKIGTPNNVPLWRKQAIRISRNGIGTEASKIRRELRKLL